MKNTNTIKLTSSALCLALTLILPFLTGQVPQIGSMLCPMHIPVLLCGYLCGWPFGLFVGFVTPLLRSLMFGMPPFYPTAVAMAFELATYGFLSGLFYRCFPKNIPFLYLSLILSMLGGRVVWGVIQLILTGLQGTSFPFSAFLAGAVTNALPGIFLQILLLPILVLSLKRIDFLKE